MSFYVPRNLGLYRDLINRSCMISNNEILNIHTFGDMILFSNYISVIAFGIGAICGFSIGAATTLI